MKKAFTDKLIRMEKAHEQILYDKQTCWMYNCKER